nr:putative retinal pigment epithelial membrane protein [Burkholderia pseudomallei]
MHLPYDQGENQHTIAVRAAALRCNKTRPAPARREPRGGERPPGRPPNAIGAIQHAGDARRHGFSPRGARSAAHPAHRLHRLHRLRRVRRVRRVSHGRRACCARGIDTDAADCI